MLAYLGHFEESVRIRTDNPIEEIWSLFLRYSDVNYLKKAWADRTEEEYTYVATCLKQSYEYFKASTNLTLYTKPVLLYYSFLNLTKATLYILKDVRPPDYHGLCKENLDHEITSVDDLLSFSAEVNNGVFKTLAETLDTNLALGKRFILEDFFNNTIELNKDFCDYFDKKKSFLIPEVDFYHNGVINVIFNNFTSNKDDSLYKLIISLFDGFTHEYKEPNLILTKKIELNHLDKDDYFKKASALFKNYFSFSIFSDEMYYINTNDKNLKLPDAVAYLGIMYILSSIVRYKPDKIYKLINDRDTSVNWLLNRVCSVVERVYPNLMLNLLHGQNIKFSSIFL
jgi:hypothetical protein